MDTGGLSHKGVSISYVSHHNSNSINNSHVFAQIQNHNLWLADYGLELVLFLFGDRVALHAIVFDSIGRRQSIQHLDVSMADLFSISATKPK
jgi:hypothetical protein